MSFSGYRVQGVSALQPSEKGICFFEPGRLCL